MRFPARCTMLLTMELSLQREREKASSTIDP